VRPDEARSTVLRQPWPSQRPRHGDLARCHWSAQWRRRNFPRRRRV